MMRRFTEYNTVIMIMPASSLLTPAATFKRAVQQPASAPTAAATQTAAMGGIPEA
ncbi:unnamed protein product, partial [marine sediment metagenome]